jgi:uncharacterized membrane protein
VSHGSSQAADARFTSRLEAFSDLVFGFSLSLLATRLDIPVRVEQIFESTRWLAVIGTFGFVCRFWLEHYRIFRHRFVAKMFDAIVNFVFLFGVAVLPYAVQTVLRFQLLLPSVALYLGDFTLILVTLSILRVRSLRQRRDDPDLADRLRVWRRSVVQLLTAILLVCFLIVLRLRGGPLGAGIRDYDGYVLGAFGLIVVLSRYTIRRLPAFLLT